MTMQATVVRRVGLILVFVGVALYAGLGQRGDLRLLFGGALLMILVGLALVLFHNLSRVDRNLLESTASAGEHSNIRDLGPGARLRRKYSARTTLALLPHFPLMAVTALMFLIFP